MRTRGGWTAATFALVGVAVVMASGLVVAESSGPSHASSPFSIALAKPKVTKLCSVPDDEAAGLYPASKSSAYLENYTDGDLSVCGSGVDHTIATPPSGFSGPDFDGMAGLKISGKLDLLLISWGTDSGYYCLGASTSGCASTVGFSLPSSFCSEQPIGTCHPNGVILSKSKGFTYVDSGNAEMVTCTKDATSCTVDGATNYFSGFEPVGIAQNGSTLYVSDLSCTGWVWSGTDSTMNRVKSIGDSLEGIAVHDGSIYVGDNGACTDSKAHVVDVSTGASLPTTLKSSDEYIGLDSDLQFDSYNTGGVYSV